MLSSPPTTKARGFSLMEIMVAVIIIGIISAIAVPKLFSIIGGAEEKALVESAASLARQASSESAIEQRGMGAAIPGATVVTANQQLEVAFNTDFDAKLGTLCRNADDPFNFGSVDAAGEPFEGNTLDEDRTFFVTDNGGKYLAAIELEGDATGPAQAATVTTKVVVENATGCGAL